VHDHPVSLHLPSRTKLQCTLQLSGQIPTHPISSLPIYVLREVNIPLPVPSVFWVMEVGIPTSPQLVSPHHIYDRKAPEKLTRIIIMRTAKLQNFQIPVLEKHCNANCEVPECTSHS
jgi:hypothetical protein